LTTPQRPLVWVAYLAALLGVMGHASSEFFVKLSNVQGAEVSVWRFMLGGFSLLVVAMVNRESRDLIGPLRKHALPILSLSLLGMAFAQFIFHLALDYASVVQVATVVTVMPIFCVFAARVVEGTRITPPKVVSGIGAFLGCMLLLTDGYLDQVTAHGDSLIGIGLSLGCAAIGAFYIVLVKPYIGRYGAIRMTTYTFSLGFIALWLVVGFAWGIWVDPMTLFDRPPVEYGAIIALGVWNTCIGFILWLWGLAHVPDVSRGNYLFFLKPVIAAMLAALILGDVITVTQMGAIAVIIGFVAAEIFYEPLRACFGGSAKGV
jgi:drug/metabolite transporter (DMT)-like permease